MVGFAHPEWLALLPLAGIAGWHAIRHRRPALRYPDLRLVAGLPRGRAVWAAWGEAVLKALAVAAVVLAAAGPRTPDLLTRLPAEGIVLVLVLDVSGSMATPDFAAPGGLPQTRLAAAKSAIRLFAAGGDAADGTHFPGRGDDRIGLVAFAAVPTTVCPLTHNHTVLLAILDGQKPREGIDAGTNVGDAIAEGLIRLDAAKGRRKVMVLLSDGEHNAGRDGPDAALKPRQAAQLAANLKVPVYAIDCGGEPMAAPDTDDALQRADGRRVLQAVAGLTGGRFFAADDAAELQAAYRDIDALERGPAETFRYRRYHEFGARFAVSAAAALTLLALLQLSVWRRVP